MTDLISGILLLVATCSGFVILAMLATAFGVDSRDGFRRPRP
jgi:hypothetical protein